MSAEDINVEFQAVVSEVGDAAKRWYARIHGLLERREHECASLLGLMLAARSIRRACALALTDAELAGLRASMEGRAAADPSPEDAEWLAQAFERELTARGEG